MPCITSSAAAWAAPLLDLVDETSAKKTHKLPPQVCVLWLPDYGGYLKSVDLSAAKFKLSPSPECAMRLNDEMAEAVGQDLIDVTGVRVHLRPYRELH
ncbi:hypothetical protein WNB94_11340 [Aquabacterium sp. A3]|uniref:hypothetical protein n=1 Tax=Aquabacterium sp. A3 TaxID=3132829 RepID=UPI003119DB38